MEQLAGSQVNPVRIADVERALSDVWRAAGDQQAGPVPVETDQRRPDVTRAAAWNLVVPCDAGAEAAVGRAVMEVVAAHPARVLLLVTEPRGMDRAMSATVTALCHRRGTSRRQVCCELITLRAAGSDARHLPDAARALLTPDLPVAVWWADAPRPTSGAESAGATATLEKELAALCDRWIVDTSGSGDAEDLAPTAALGGRLRGAVSDLAWMRLLPWRELTAQFFDPAPFREQLQALDRLEVWVTPNAGLPSEALLWLGWVSSRLGWSVERALGDSEWRLQRNGREAVAAVRRGPLPEGLGAIPLSPNRIEGKAEILAACISASEPRTSFTLGRGPQEECATLIVDTEGACPLPRVVRLPGSPRARLLAAALSEPRRDLVYPEALAIAAQMLEGTRDP